MKDKIVENSDEDSEKPNPKVFNEKKACNSQESVSCNDGKGKKTRQNLVPPLKMNLPKLPRASALKKILVTRDKVDRN